MGEFPENTIGVYSYSKYFGCTGWRLGTIAVYEDNIFDKMIAAHPEPTKKQLDKRYGGLTLKPREFAFIDRIVADSRDIALNHTAGLSLPQQVMACVGLAAGPSFFSGLQKSGISLVFVGLVIAILPHTVSILFGRYVLRMNPVIVLGACSGAGTITAALRAIQEEAQSDLPALGYTVPYAIGNIVLTACER